MRRPVTVAGCLAIAIVVRPPLVAGETAASRNESPPHSAPAAASNRNVPVLVAWVNFGLGSFGQTPDGPVKEPNAFTPTELDPASWVEELTAAGFARIVIVAKSDDSFCLWPTGRTERSVLGSANPRDVVGEVAKACHKAGIAFGIAYSLRDRTARDPAVELGTASAHLKFLCETYGPLDSVHLIDTGELDLERLRGAIVPVISHLEPAAKIHFQRTSLPEPAMSLRPHWYWRQADNEHVKPARQLEEQWFETIGRGQDLYLGITPDHRGVIPAPDRATLAALAKSLRASFDEGRLGQVEGRELRFDRPRTVNRLRVTTATETPIAFGVEARTADGWTSVTSDQRCVRQRTLRIPPVTADALRVTAEAPSTLTFEAFCAPPTVRVVAPEGAFRDAVSVALEADLPASDIYYTLDGSEPTPASDRYTGPLTLTQASRVRAIAVHEGRPGLEAVSQDVVRFDPALFRPAIQFVRAPSAGLRLRRVDGRHSSLAALTDHFASDMPDPQTPESLVPTVALPADRPKTAYGLRFEGLLNVPADGIYTFSMRSDDASALYVHDALVVDHGDGASWEWWDGRLALCAGWHPLRIEFLQIDGEDRLQLRWSGPGIPEGNIPAAVLGHE
jgi:hypothetical protein